MVVMSCEDRRTQTSPLAPKHARRYSHRWNSGSRTSPHGPHEGPVRPCCGRRSAEEELRPGGEQGLLFQGQVVVVRVQLRKGPEGRPEVVLLRQHRLHCLPLELRQSRGVSEALGERIAVDLEFGDLQQKGQR